MAAQTLQPFSIQPANMPGVALSPATLSQAAMSAAALPPEFIFPSASMQAGGAVSPELLSAIAPSGIEFGWPEARQFRLASLFQWTAVCGLALAMLRWFSPAELGQALIYGGLIVTIGSVAVPVTGLFTRSWSRAGQFAASSATTLLASAALAGLLLAVSP